MEEIKLDVQVRTAVGTRKVKSVRRHDFVPAVVYGGEKKPTSIQLDRRTYERIMRHHRGQSVVFHLNVLEGSKKLRDYSAIVKEEQMDPVKDSLVHIDFKRISLTQEIEVKVQIIAKGEAIGVKQDGGSLDQPLREVDVVCLPTNIPEKIEVDVSELHIGDSIHLKDVQLPADVKTKHDLEAMVVSVVPPMKEAEASGDEGAEPEVIGEKEKKEAAQVEKSEDKPEEKKSEG